MVILEDYEQPIRDFIRNTLQLSHEPHIEETSEDIQAVIELRNADEYGVVFSRFDKNPNLKQYNNNDDFTELKANTMYRTTTKPLYIINLLGDLTSDNYKVVVTYNK